MSQLAHFFGLDNLSGPFYGFWSGVGPTPLTWLFVLSLYLWHHNCHVHGCWRFSPRKVPGTDRVACMRHHPAHGVTHEELTAEYAAAKR